MIKTARTGANGGGGLRLHWLLSAAVHAGLLGGLALLPPGGAPEPGVPVRLVQLAPEEKTAAHQTAPIQAPAPPSPPFPPAAAREAAAPKPRAPERAAQPPNPPLAKKKESAPREATSAKPAPRKALAAPPQQAKPAPLPEEERAAPPTPPEGARPAPPASAPPPGTASLPPLPGGETLSPQLLRERLAQIVARIERAKRYPEGARLMGIEGTAVVAFRIRPDGRVEGLAIRETAGHPALDEATLEAVRRAQPLPYVRHALVLPVRYTLREADR